MSAAKVIAIYVDDPAYARLLDLLDGVSRYVRSRNDIAFHSYPLRSVLLGQKKLLDWNGDGILGFFYDKSWVEALLARGITVVNLTEELAALKLPLVVLDNQKVGQLAAAHLMERGFSRFGYIGLPDTIFGAQRQQGFVGELKKAGFKPSVIQLECIRREGLTVKWFADRFGETPKPLGVLTADDDIAARVLVAAQATGLRVPQDLAIVGVNNLELICELSSIPLTSIDLAPSKVGFEAANLLNDIMHGRRPASAVVRVPPAGLVKRMSTHFLAFADPLLEKALGYMHANVRHVYNVGHVVRHCGKSRPALEQHCSRHLGHSVLEEIHRIRIERAKYLLADTEWSLNRVAEECGFVHADRLTEVFGRIVGMTPSAYRKL